MMGGAEVSLLEQWNELEMTVDQDWNYPQSSVYTAGLFIPPACLYHRPVNITGLFTARPGVLGRAPQ